MIITIDGPAGTGKSTVAKRLAQALHFVYFDTGAMYRALTALMIEQGIHATDEKNIAPLLASFDFSIQNRPSGLHYLVNGRDLTEVIRSPEVTRWVSAVAAQPLVRNALVSIQRRFSQGNNAVFEGRDLGSVVFPNADLKVYLIASAEERADRRHRELKQRMGDQAPTKEEVFKDLNRRDHEDSSRLHSPLVRPEHSIQVDTSALSIDEVVSTLLDIWHQRNRSPSL